jgi:hypothetical protein
MLGYPLHLTLINHPRYALLGRTNKDAIAILIKTVKVCISFSCFSYSHSPSTATLSQSHNPDFSLTVFTLTYNNHTHRKHGQCSSKQAL